LNSEEHNCASEEGLKTNPVHSGACVGRPRWEPTERQRAAVKLAAKRGVTQDLIAALMGISESTLKRRCCDELRFGNMAGVIEVGWVAYKMAISGKHPAMTRWVLRVRAGWR
jgi:hypothetical protein